MTSGQYSFGRRSYRGRIHRMQVHTTGHTIKSKSSMSWLTEPFDFLERV